MEAKMMQTAPSPDDLACQVRDEFARDMHRTLNEAEKRMAALQEERERVGYRFERQSEAIQEVIDMCRGALQQSRQPW